jgi:hypothetical protein
LSGDGLIPVSRGEIDGLQVLPLSAARPYVNNFFFVPQERAVVLQRLRAPR